MESIKQAPQYGIDQSQVPIYFVTTPQDWAYCEVRLLKAQIVGLDTETRSALLQLALHDAENNEEVFILDLRQLPAELYSPILSTVFLSDDILKPGVTFAKTCTMAQSYPNAPCFAVCKNFVEVNDVSAVVTGSHPPISLLQNLVLFYLRRKLSKSQQLSNWERRPLSVGQIHYAAADALALLDLDDEILLRSKGKAFHLRDVIATLDVNVPATPKCKFCFESFDSPTELKTHRQDNFVPLKNTNSSLPTLQAPCHTTSTTSHAISNFPPKCFSRDVAWVKLIQ